MATKKQSAEQESYFNPFVGSITAANPETATKKFKTALEEIDEETQKIVPEEVSEENKVVETPQENLQTQETNNT